MRFHSLFRFKTLCRPLSNNRGQGLIEYLVIVALVGVATIGIMRTVGSAVNSRFGSIAKTLGAKQSDIKSAGVGERRDMTNFMKDAGGGGGSSKGGSGGLRDDARSTSNNSDSSSSSGGDWL